MKPMDRIACFLISLSIATQAGAGNYVEDFGSDGWFGSTDFLDHAEEFLGMGGTCEEAGKAEFDLVEERTYANIRNAESIRDSRGFDNWTEELVFSDAAYRVSQQINCQARLYEGLDSNITEVLTMERTAWAEFQLVNSKLRELLREEGIAQAELDSVNNAYNFVEDRFIPSTTRYFEEQRSRTRAALNEVKAKIALAMSRIPLGNRQEMRDEIRDLMSSDNVSETRFLNHYRQGVSKLKIQARKSKEFFDGITVDGQSLHWVDEDLKKSLMKTGVVKNVVEGMGLETELRDKFMCRARARYQRGPESLLAAEIPLYFAGVYGLGRAAMALGAKGISAASSIGRASATAARWGAKAAMLGIEMYAYARIADEVRQVCWPDEFTSAIQRGNCSFESEVQGVYQEASIAQCATMATLGFGPVAAVGIYRVARPIVVTSSRARMRFYLSASRSDELARNARLQRIIRNNDLDSAAASRLTDEERIFIFEQMADIALTRAQAARVLQAHEIGQGFGRYTLADIRAKAQTLREVLAENHITGVQARVITRNLMRRGVFGALEDLPAAAQAKIAKIDEITQSKPLQETPVTRRNNYTHSGARSAEDIFVDHPQIKEPMIVINDLMADSAKWNAYMKEITQEVFERMAQSSNPQITASLEQGIMARSVLLDVFKDRFATRGLEISVIPSDAGGVIGFDAFRARLSRGPLLDDAFLNDLQAHGPYPHLYQLDYVIDDAMRASQFEKHQDFFTFWGGSEDGLSIWNDFFDLFGESTRTLKDTQTITRGYLDEIGINNDI